MEKKIQNTKSDNAIWKKNYRIEKCIPEIQIYKCILKKKIQNTKSDTPFWKIIFEIQKYIPEIQNSEIYFEKEVPKVFIYSHLP